MGENSLFPFNAPRELYQWFLFTYGFTALCRIAIEAYKQIAILKTAWYDVPTAAIAILEYGFIQHVLLSLAIAEGINVVLGALYKQRVRQERDREWREWLRRKAEADRNGEPFDEPSPDEQSRSNNRRS